MLPQISKNLDLKKGIEDTPLNIHCMENFTSVEINSNRNGQQQQLLVYAIFVSFRNISVKCSLNACNCFSVMQCIVTFLALLHNIGSNMANKIKVISQLLQWTATHRFCYLKRLLLTEQTQTANQQFIFSLWMQTEQNYYFKFPNLTVNFWTNCSQNRLKQVKTKQKELTQNKKF